MQRMLLGKGHRNEREAQLVNRPKITMHEDSNKLIKKKTKYADIYEWNTKLKENKNYCVHPQVNSIFTLRMINCNNSKNNEERNWNGGQETWNTCPLANGEEHKMLNRLRVMPFSFRYFVAFPISDQRTEHAKLCNNSFVIIIIEMFIHHSRCYQTSS